MKHDCIEPARPRQARSDTTLPGPSQDEAPHLIRTEIHGLPDPDFTDCPGTEAHPGQQSKVQHPRARTRIPPAGGQQRARSTRPHSDQHFGRKNLAPTVGAIFARHKWRPLSGPTIWPRSGPRTRLTPPSAAPCPTGQAMRNGGGLHSCGPHSRDPMSPPVLLRGKPGGRTAKKARANCDRVEGPREMRLPSTGSDRMHHAVLNVHIRFASAKLQSLQLTPS